MAGILGESSVLWGRASFGSLLNGAVRTKVGGDEILPQTPAYFFARITVSTYNVVMKAWCRERNPGSIIIGWVEGCSRVARIR